MALQCGIVGLPNAGKSTLFNALSTAKAEAAPYPFCTIEPNVGTINVPDDRLYRIAALVQEDNAIPTTIEFLDIAGLVEGASKGEGLGNQFLAAIGETDAIIHVLRCFEEKDVAHPSGSVDPVRDKEIIDTELQLKDLSTIEKRLEKARKAAKSGEKKAQAAVAILERIEAQLNEGKPVRSLHFDEEEQHFVNDLFLLTAKPVLYVCNVNESDVNQENTYVQAVAEVIEEEKAHYLTISAEIEAEISALDDPADRQAFLEDMGLSEAGVNRLIKESYRLLDLITFFTIGDDEVRAWTVKRGTLAPAAAGQIHTDFEKEFVKAEVIKYPDFDELESVQACRNEGKLHIEGKDYAVADGDIIYFRTTA